MKIGQHLIEPGQPPYVVAEISGNHGGDIKNAIALIKAAKHAGADAAKTQCYEPDTITIDCKKLDFIVQNGLWQGRTLYELYGKACTPLAWHKDLYRAAKDEGITLFSSVFDSSSVDLLETLGCPAYKIASFEITDLPLIKYASQTGKPLIISTGMATEDEILDAWTMRSKEIAFLHCISEYPGRCESADLDRYLKLRAKFAGNPNVILGLSDHSPGDLVPTMAIALGACIIEKHLRLPDVDSEDASFSLDPTQFAIMVQTIKVAHQAMQPRKLQQAGRQFRRSLYAVNDIKKGEPFTLDNIRSIRPGYGLPPKMLPGLLGKPAARAFRRGDPLE